MDQRLREQIRLVLDDATDRARKASSERLQAVYVDRNRRGLLHSSITVGGAIESLKEDASRYVADCVDRVAAIDKSIEAFAMLSEANQRFLTFLTARFDEAVRKGLGGRGEQSRAPNFDDQFTKMWREACERSTRELEIHRFAFTKPSLVVDFLPSVDKMPQKKNEGASRLLGIGMRCGRRSRFVSGTAIFSPNRKPT